MRVDPLLGALGPDADPTPETLALLDQLAGQFLRCGGSISLCEYRAMSGESRAALSAAAGCIRDDAMAALADRILEGVKAEAEAVGRQAGDEIAEVLASREGT